MSKLQPITGTFLLLAIAAGSAHTAERPTLNHTCDPRPDILPHPFYYAHTEYRRAYNRPRDVSGWIADKIAPSSQEAMVWAENVAAGNYDRKHLPPMYKRYCYPKPWEVLNTGPRPDFGKPSPVNQSTVTQPSVVENKIPISPGDTPEPLDASPGLNDSSGSGDELLRTPPVPVPTPRFR